MLQAKGKQLDGQIDLSQELRSHLGEWGYRPYWPPELPFPMPFMSFTPHFLRRARQLIPEAPGNPARLRAVKPFTSCRSQIVLML